MGLTVMQMMSNGQKGGTAPVPTQTFGVQNILGTAVPQVGDNAGNPTYSSQAASGVTSKSVVIIVVALIALGYVVHHVNFEK